MNSKNILYVEWLIWMEAYRLYDPKHPQQTVAYEDNLEDAEKHALENGYAGIHIHEKKFSSSRKYECPCCHTSVRATKKVRVMCMICQKQMEVRG